MLDRRCWLILVTVILFGGTAAAWEATVERGGSAVVPASFANAFTIEFDGEFDGRKLERWTAKRFAYDGGNNQSLDLFEPGCFRLGNTRIAFTSATKGKIRNPGGNKDHYAIVRSFQGRHKVRLGYDRAALRCRLWIDGSLEGDFALEVRKAGSVGRLVFPGFAGKVRLEEGSGGSSGLDEVVSGSPGTGTGGTELTAGNSGNRTVTTTADGQLQVIAKLSTYGPATLAVTITRDGTERRWLEWKRQDGGDRSPLQVDGKPRADSMFEREPGDFSPHTVKEATAVRKGDVVLFTLTGEFGDGTPLLRYTMPR
jgi:hypothetical protein